MARFPLTLLSVVLALVPAGCDRQPDAPQVTVKLPPARPAPARPAFTFKRAKPAEPRPEG